MPRAAVSKAQSIRDIHREQPSLRPGEIVAALKSRGVKVTSGQVSTTLSAAKPRGKQASKAGSNHNALEAAVTFCNAAGGLDQARGILETIARIR